MQPRRHRGMEEEEDKELYLLLFKVFFFKLGFGDVYWLLFCHEQVTGDMAWDVAT